MEKRENVLREALEQNEKEIQQWQSYVEGNETAINNMNMFSKKLTVDVMVPFGKKAYFPGRIIHTNEVLVAHYQDYFSECSAYTATEICKQRIENGKNRITELEAERDLFQNKLEKPHLDGVLPNSDEREIIEEYDEEKEKNWREQHRERIREAKLKEKQEREEILTKRAENDVLQTLDDDEKSISELSEELAELEMEYANETEELLKKLISGEVDLPPPKKRIAHASVVKRDGEVKPKSLQSSIDNPPKKPIEECQIKSDLEDDGNDSDTSISEIPEEIRLLEEQAGFLPENDRAGFYQYQLQIINQKLTKRSFSNNKELEEKLHLFKIRDYLEELLEEGSDADLDSNVIEKNADDAAVDVDNNLTNAPKRRISFAMENQMLEFRKNETVAQMLPNILPNETIPKRDIIKLDEPNLIEDPNKESGKENLEKPVEKRKTILEKVEENLKTNNLEDADLVNKIIDSSLNRIQTLHIHFKHSSSLGTSCSYDVKTEIPRTPADFFNLFNSNENNEMVKITDSNFYLKESDRERAYVDVRSEFLTPKISSEEPQAKSILKNKCAVERETHIPEKDEETKIVHKKQQKKTKDEEGPLSAYNKVMGDVIENPTEPDPLPNEKFVNMHAPKKRISRFKQMRNDKV